MPDASGNWYKGDGVPIVATLTNKDSGLPTDATNVEVDLVIRTSALASSGSIIRVSVNNAMSRVSAGVYQYVAPTLEPATGLPRESWIARVHTDDDSVDLATADFRFTVLNPTLL